MMLAVLGQTEDVFSPVSCQGPMRILTNLTIFTYLLGICNTDFLSQW